MPERTTLRSITRLTSAAGSSERERTRALHRALWLQQQRLHGVYVNGANLIGAHRLRDQQEALCAQLEFLITEARALLEGLPEDEG